tara:strand:+ start:255 stop:668 length:414 start_codon:yes stop_codon:yes gene_type:complete
MIPIEVAKLSGWDGEDRLKKEMEKYQGNGEVKIIGFFTYGDDDTPDHKKLPISENFSMGDNVPEELSDQMRATGWVDMEGTICFPDYFRPDPVMGSDGNVYVAVSSNTMECEVTRTEVMVDAFSLLNASGENTHSLQ